MTLAARAVPVPILESPLEVDARQAEGLLYELAAVLRRVPLEDRTRELHVRALGLKRDVTRWRAALEPEPERRRLIDELMALQDEARALRDAPREVT